MWSQVVRWSETFKRGTFLSALARVCLYLLVMVGFRSGAKVLKKLFGKGLCNRHMIRLPLLEGLDGNLLLFRAQHLQGSGAGCYDCSDLRIADGNDCFLSTGHTHALATCFCKHSTNQTRLDKAPTKLWLSHGRWCPKRGGRRTSSSSSSSAAFSSTASLFHTW